MEKVIIPIQVEIKTRDETTSKDATLVNGYIEPTPSKVLHTVKRPGINLGVNGYGSAGGIFTWNDGTGGTGSGLPGDNGDQVYSWVNGTPATIPNVYPAFQIHEDGSSFSSRLLTSTLTGSGSVYAADLGLWVYPTATVTGAGSVYAAALSTTSLYAAVGSSGGNAYIWNSTDALSWATVGSFGAGIFHSVAFGGGTFVTVGRLTTGGGSIKSSTNTTGWASRSYSGTVYAFLGVAYVNSQFVAVGVTSSSSDTSGEVVVYSSPTGVTWTLKATITLSGLIYSSRPVSISYGAGVYVIQSEILTKTADNSEKGYLAYSSDLISWTSVVDATSSNRPASLSHGSYFGNNIFVSTSVDQGEPSGAAPQKSDALGKIRTSSDGSSYTTQFTESTNYQVISDVVYNGSLWIAAGGVVYGDVSGSAKVYYSSNATSWTAVTVVADGRFNAITYRPSAELFLSAGFGNWTTNYSQVDITPPKAIIYTSANGSSWTSRFTGVDNSEIRGIA